MFVDKNKTSHIPRLVRPVMPPEAIMLCGTKLVAPFSKEDAIDECEICSGTKEKLEAAATPIKP